MAKRYKSNHYKNGMELAQHVAFDIEKVIKAIFQPITDIIRKKMEIAISEFYKFRPTWYERSKNGGFKDSLVITPPDKRNGKWVVRVRFAPELLEIDGARVRNRRIGRDWGMHNEFRDINELFVVLDKKGWYFPVAYYDEDEQGNRSRQEFHEPARALPEAIKYVESDAFNKLILEYLSANDWNIHKK